MSIVRLNTPLDSYYLLYVLQTRHVALLVRQGQLRKAVQRLEDTAPMAPLTDDTFHTLQQLHPDGPDLAPHIPQALPAAAQLPRDAYTSVLRSLPQGIAPGPSQLRYEHIRLISEYGGEDVLADLLQSVVEGDLPAGRYSSILC